MAKTPLFDRVKNAWNVFIDRNSQYSSPYRGISASYRPDRPRFTRGNERSIVTSVYNRLSMDAAAIDIKHVKLDENDRYSETIDSGLNTCFSLSANIDQTGRAFKQDIYMSMLDEGCVAIVPVDTTSNPDTGSYDICTMRTGKIVDWKPRHVRVSVYNDRTGHREEVEVPKESVAIVENPLYSVINESNSVMQRLIRNLIYWTR